MGTVKTCSRCKGSGNVGAALVHLGEPGRCFQCDGAGKTYHPTMKQRVDRFVARCESSLQDLVAQADRLKAALDNLSSKRRFARANLEQELDLLRQAYRSTRQAMVDAQAAGKVSNKQQPATDSLFHWTRRN